MIVPPGFKSPSFSAASIIDIAARSFMLPPGLVVSIFAITGHGKFDAIFFNCTMGVSPIKSSTDSATSKSESSICLHLISGIAKVFLLSLPTSNCLYLQNWILLKYLINEKRELSEFVYGFDDFYCFGFYLKNG